MRPGEVVVSRRLYRSGQSEYLINGRVGKAPRHPGNVHGVGLARTPTHHEQGRIGLILSTKPWSAAPSSRKPRRNEIQNKKASRSQAGILEGQSLARQRHRVEVEKTAWFAGSVKPPSAPLLRNPRSNARIVSPDAAGKARELDAEAERTTKQLEELTAAEFAARHHHPAAEASRTG